jgi:HPt (histidine-containing phosphotransfer) domain-containing protein
MNKSLSDNTFSFSEPFDSQYIFELYAGDYVMIGETFADVLKEYDEFVQKIHSSYEAKDMAALKSAVHKIKPLFGFVGLVTIESQCLQFENACQSTLFSGLDVDYTALKTTLIQAKKIIETEKERLLRYNEQF